VIDDAFVRLFGPERRPAVFLPKPRSICLAVLSAVIPARSYPLSPNLGTASAAGQQHVKTKSRSIRFSMSAWDPHSLFGATLSSERFKSALQLLSPTPPEPEVKAYSDVVYLNFYPLGVSFQFHPTSGYRPPRNATKLVDLDGERLHLGGIDVYNHSGPSSSSTSAWSPFLAYPITFRLPATDAEDPTRLEVTPETTGKRLVEVLGEPDRKGGGEGARGGNIGTWVEWTELGIMVEWKAVGPKAWEEGADAPWSVLTVFEKGKAAGASTE
jgi:hypothetical protein